MPRSSARIFKMENTDHREACLISPPAFLPGQRVKVSPMFGGKTFTTEVTSVFLRTTVAPRWQYTVKGGGTVSPFGMGPWERHYEEPELEGLTPEEDGPSGDGRLGYEDLMIATARRQASKIAYELAKECKETIDDMSVMIGRENAEAYEKNDQLWRKICDLVEEARILCDSLEYESPRFTAKQEASEEKAL